MNPALITTVITGAPVVPGHEPCKYCGRPRAEFPMAFRRDHYCSDKCRKALNMDLER